MLAAGLKLANTINNFILVTKVSWYRVRGNKQKLKCLQIEQQG